MRGNYAALQAAEAERDAAKEALRCERELRAKLASEIESLKARAANAIEAAAEASAKAAGAHRAVGSAEAAAKYLSAELATSAKERWALTATIEEGGRQIAELRKDKARLADRLERASTPSKADAKADRRLASKQAEIDALTSEVHKLKAFIRSLPKDVTIRREPQAGDTQVTPEAYGRLERINTFTPDDVALSVDSNDRGLAILSRGPERLGTIRIDDGSIDLRAATAAIVGDMPETPAATVDAHLEQAFAGTNPTPLEAPSV